MKKFQIVMDGYFWHCAAFETEAALEKVLGGGLDNFAPAPMEEIRPEPEVRPRGRPSYDAIIAAAMGELDPPLDPATELSARIRRICRHLAETRDADEVPAAKTVRTFLTTKKVG